MCVYIYVAFMSASLVTHRYVCECMSTFVRVWVCGMYVSVSRDGQICLCVHGDVVCECVW